MKQFKHFSALFLFLCSYLLWADGRTTPSTQKSNFGKTHFIVGYEDYELEDSQDRSFADEYPDEPIADGTICLDKQGKLCTALFAPDHNLRASLRHLIKHEQEKISIAVFTFTDSHVARELMQAHKRGVKIELITDASCLQGQYEKVSLLNDAGIPVYVYKSKLNKGSSSIMHNKFALFSKTVHEKKVVWTGSFNFTKSGSDVNQENVLILDDPNIVRQYGDQFEKLKNRTEKLRGATKTVMNRKGSITTIPS